MLEKSIAPLATYISFWLFAVVVVVFTQKATAPSIIALYILQPCFQSLWFTLRQINTKTHTILHKHTYCAQSVLCIQCTPHDLFAIPNNKSPLNWNMGINWRFRTVYENIYKIYHANYQAADKLTFEFRRRKWQVRRKREREKNASRRNAVNTMK